LATRVGSQWLAATSVAVRSEQGGKKSEIRGNQLQRWIAQFRGFFDFIGRPRANPSSLTCNIHDRSFFEILGTSFRGSLAGAKIKLIWLGQGLARISRQQP
jgi:hypothetical protein